MSLPLPVYIAEDHTALRNLLASHLAIQGKYQVVGQTGDGRQVLDDCRRCQPKLLILDLGLPGLGGIDIARAVRSELPHTYILIFTSHDDPVSVRQAMEAGAKGMVEKSASIEVLSRAIDTVSAGRAFFGEAVSQALQRTFVDPIVTRSDDTLTAREREVLQLVAEGFSSKQICARLDITVRTAENHRHNIMRKLDAHNAADLTRAAYRLGLLRGDGDPSRT